MVEKNLCICGEMVWLEAMVFHIDKENMIYLTTREKNRDPFINPRDMSSAKWVADFMLAIRIDNDEVK